MANGKTSTTPKIPGLTLAALGIIYGDIGTSPLYALRESLHGLSLTPSNVLGILSSIFWALILIISIKYLLIIIRADNNGEGGVLALLTLIKNYNKKFFAVFLVLAVIGAGLLLGDGTLTPAISVLSAVEGLKVISPWFSPSVIPLTCLILLWLFWQQHRGTSKIGAAFGPIMLMWFITLGVLGVMGIIHNPVVLKALNPYWCVHFFTHHGPAGLVVLGGVFLVVTGGEALYADLGHFGRLPIQLGWFFCALPGLVLNYFGQGAFLLQHPQGLQNPFYALAPNGFLYPLILLATAATIIASQAVISAVFSLTRQAALLDLIPETRIVQTSAELQGQIYVPFMNWVLAIGTLLWVIIFESSAGLASIYGIAVNLVMLVVTILVTLAARQLWQWPRSIVAIVFGIFIGIDLLFLTANGLKISHGGWIPLLIAGITSVLMLTWYHGIQLLRELFYKKRPELLDSLEHLQKSSKIQFIPDMTAVFITDPNDNSGGGLLQYLKFNRTLPEQVVILSISIENTPYITDMNRFKLSKLSDGFYRLVLQYGFMQIVDVPEAFEQINKRAELPLNVDLNQIVFFTETRNITVTNYHQDNLYHWQKKLFAFLQHNGLPSIKFYRLPVHKTIAIGIYYEI